MRRPSTTVRILTRVALPLALGAAIYLLLRPTAPRFVAALLEVPIAGPRLAQLREWSVPAGADASWLHMIPDAAWAFALGALLSIVWRGGARRARAAWCAIGLAAALGYEMAQRWHWVPGWFDASDLVAEAVGYALGWLSTPPDVR